MEKSKKRITAKIKDTIERILKDAKVLREDMESLYKIPDNRKAPGVYASKNDVKAIYCGGQDISLVCKGSEKKLRYEMSIKWMSQEQYLDKD